MTEEEWLTSASPDPMLPLLGGGERKLRLFACACCREAWNVFVPPFVIRMVTAVEAFADGSLGPRGLEHISTAAERAAEAAAREAAHDDSGYLAHVARAAFGAAHSHAATAAKVAHGASALAAADAPATIIDGPLGGRTGRTDYEAELAAQADLLRDIFGNPFRSVEFHLEWFTSDVLALARGIYADRAFDRMPILADALQDAGCDDDDILTHCREPREHARGCWVVDLLLGKK